MLVWPTAVRTVFCTTLHLFLLFGLVLRLIAGEDRGLFRRILKLLHLVCAARRLELLKLGLAVQLGVFRVLRLLQRLRLLQGLRRLFVDVRQGLGLLKLLYLLHRRLAVIAVAGTRQDGALHGLGFHLLTELCGAL